MKEKNLPLVSVIVPSYNHAQYIEETIESIVNQTYPNIELIVIDDGSKDNSKKLLTELSKKYGFCLITRDNKGLSATLNEGIKLANGYYIGVCASDDKFELNKIEEQINFMENNTEYGMCYTDRIKFYENGIIRKIKNKYYRSGDIFKDILCQYLAIPAGSALYKKSIFNDIGLFDTTLAIEDFDMFLRIASKHKIGYLNKYLFYYRSHMNNTSNNIQLMTQNINKILDKWKDNDFYKCAMIRKNLILFKGLASTDKLNAIQKLPKKILILKEKAFYEGLIRLMIPKALYNKIMKR